VLPSNAMAAAPPGGPFRRGHSVGPARRLREACLRPHVLVGTNLPAVDSLARRPEVHTLGSLAAKGPEELSDDSSHRYVERTQPKRLIAEDRIFGATEPQAIAVRDWSRPTEPRASAQSWRVLDRSLNGLRLDPTTHTKGGAGQYGQDRHQPCGQCDARSAAEQEDYGRDKSDHGDGAGHIDEE
jgi:hypothetical protein